MKKIVVLFFCCYLTTLAAQEEKVAFKDGEWLRYKMSYSGFLRAGTAVLELKEEKLNEKEVIHATGKGWTSGMISWFFKLNDTYESYFSASDVKPYLFKRDIDEGGHKKRRDVTFDHDKNTAFVYDYLQKKDTTISVTGPQDMISTFYFLRNYDTKNMKAGEEISVDMFFDFETYSFKLQFLGYETLRTKFGKVRTQKFRPIVQAGRVFKAKESVIVWITADENKIPIRMKASLAVGSLRAELEAYKGLANSFSIVVD